MTDSYSELSDHQLLEKIAERDSHGLEVLFERYAAIVFSLARKTLEQDDRAGEALLAVFDIVWNKVEYYDSGIANAYTWLILLTRNKSVDMKKRAAGNSGLPEYTDEFENKYIVPHLSTEIDTLDLKTALKVKDNLEGALANLTDAQQYVIFLAFYAGFTQQQISKELNIPLETVRLKVKQALTKLRDNLLEGEKE